MFGSVFHFVVNDVKDKISILKSHRQSEAGLCLEKQHCFWSDRV